MNHKNLIKHFSFGNWAMGLAAFIVIVVGLFDFAGWISLTIDHLAQIIIVGIGILMFVTVIQSAQHKIELEDSKHEFQKFVGDHIDFMEFNKVEHGIDYMANKMLTARSKVDHASISSPLPRHYTSMSDFEKHLEDVAIANHVKIRYVAKTDKHRLKRIKNLLTNPLVNTYYVKTISPDSLSIPIMNFMIIDNEEIILAIPSFGEGFTFVAAKGTGIIKPFEGFFNLLWAEAEEIDQSIVANS